MWHKVTGEKENKDLEKVVLSSWGIILKGIANSLPNQKIVINSLVLQEAKDSSEIENIITTYD